MKDRIQILKEWLSETPTGKKKLEIAYESYKDEAKRLRKARKELNYIPNKEDYNG